ncbi:MAG: hypothetical protein BWX80_03234 [Candidatus Hydrogenedentes bacterium ADurb.Bin101]|nr:MAG: hypothetical protein BWX80_03234 [Candidatus Hydrogenedentes bacterium ADurb.Bin101]
MGNNAVHRRLHGLITQLQFGDFQICLRLFIGEFHVVPFRGRADTLLITSFRDFIGRFLLLHRYPRLTYLRFQFVTLDLYQTLPFLNHIADFRRHAQTDARSFRQHLYPVLGLYARGRLEIGCDIIPHGQNGFNRRDKNRRVFRLALRHDRSFHRRAAAAQQGGAHQQGKQQ